MSDAAQHQPVEPAEIGVFGGSGLYALLDDPVEVEVLTPYGAPSGPLHLGQIAGRRVAFLPRHGPGHELPPHRINYRANVWALHQVGVTRILAPCASGSLQPEVGRHEPALALFSGPQGLDAPRTLLATAGAHLAAGAWLVMELGLGQAGRLASEALALGWAEARVGKDSFDVDRFLACRRAA